MPLNGSAFLPFHPWNTQIYFFLKKQLLANHLFLVFGAQGTKTVEQTFQIPGSDPSKSKAGHTYVHQWTKVA